MLGLRILSVALALFGTLGALFGILEWLDPVAAKMADDGDPFGSPSSRTKIGLMVIVYLCLAVVGAYLFHRLSPHRMKRQ